MKKTFRNYLGIWAVLLALFNVIAFASVGWSGQEKYTVSFWTGYICITLMFAGQLFCAWKVFQEENLQKSFYKLPLLRISYHGLIWSFVLGGASMLISPLPYWVGAILCAIVLVVTVIAVLKSSTVADLAENVDKKIKMQTGFIRLLTVDAENLLSCAKTESAKSSCKKVYEAIRYSDPMSSDALSSVEEKISAQMEVLTVAVAVGDETNIATAARKVVELIDKRNQKCKVLK